MPHDQVTAFLSKGAIFLGDANGPHAGMDFLKVERGVEWMFLPEPVFCTRQLLNFGGNF
jgi:hypothetical protein